ncbi:MAG: UvrD-helicase domain-containing protein [Treponema sp.]
MTKSTENYDYLDLLSRKLDAAQKKACCRTENAVVAAGAGSGKTQTLATRFAWLVMSQNVPVSEILTLTFTNKAAAEMYSRIYETLQFFAHNPAVPPREKENARRAAEEFSGAHIQTLDSYCASLVRKAANRYGIRPDFTAGSADSSQAIREAAFSFALKHRDDEAVQYFAEAGKLQDFSRDYFAAIIERCSSIADDDKKFSTFLAAQKNIIAAEWNKASGMLGSLLTELRAALTENAVPDDPYFFSLTDALETFPETFKIQSPVLIGSDSSISASARDLASSLKRISELKTGRRGKLPAAVKAVNDVHKELNALCSSAFLPMAAFIAQYPHTERLFSLLDDFKAEVDAQKRSTGKLTFRDIAETALKILCEQGDIRQEEKKSYSKIMIDEFQDNNASNRDLLFLLAEEDKSLADIRFSSSDADAVSDALKNRLTPDKLFFVGDEKQSIYKFRGADVAVFNELTRDLQTECLKMTANYRSAPELLASFNILFGGYGQDLSERMPAVFDETPSESFEAAYPADARAKKPDALTHKDAPQVPISKENVRTHVCLADDDFLSAQKKLTGADAPEYLDAPDQEAYFIAAKIKSLYEASPEDERSYSDFAVLDVKRTRRAKLTFWFNRLGIPYAVDVQSGVFREAIVNDVYAFIRLCVYPSDAAAFASFLRSPFAGLSVNGAISVLTVFAESGAPAFDTGKDDEIRTSLSPSDFEKYRAAALYYAAARPKVLSRKLTLTIEELWYERGFHYETLLSPAAALIAEQFDLLFELARQTDEAGKSPAWFVDRLLLVRESEKNSFAPKPDIELENVAYPVEKGDAVQIMTVHKSKGLQFAHVFITGCFQKPKNDRAEKFFYDDEAGLSLKPRLGEGNFFFLRQKERADKKTLAEFKRIIYVAITRAEKSAYIVGTKKKQKDESKSILENIVDFYYGQDFPPPSEKPAEIFRDGAPFDLVMIPLQEKSLLYADTAGATGKAAFSKQEFAREKSAGFEKAHSVLLVPSEVKKITPSSLETFERHDGTQAAGNFIEEKRDFLNAGAADELTDSSFTPADFGTLVHDCLFKWAAGAPLEHYAPPAALLKNLNAAERAQKRAECLELCAAFAQSPLAAAFLDAKKSGRFWRAEWAFKHFSGGNIVKGAMDLIFQTADGAYTIVDYKTDSDYAPERYTAQQKCYRQAAAALLGVDEAAVQTTLYYLRRREGVVVGDNS